MATATHPIAAPASAAGVPPTAPGGRFRRLSRRAWQTLVFVVFLLAALRAFLPFLVEDYANRTLSKIPGYRARIADVDLHLWRGAYTIEGLDVVKTDGEVPVPFFSSPVVELSVAWRGVFRGALVGEIELHEPKLNFVAGPTPAESQTTVDRTWQERVRELFPLRIDRFEIFRGELHYRDFHSKPQVDLVVDRIHAVARNLTNSEEISKTLVATIDVEGRPLGSAKLTAHADLDPYREKPTFAFAGKLEKVDLRKLNDFLKAYGNFDVQAGRLDFYAEVAAADGDFQGYVKPLVEDLDVFDLDEGADSFLQKAWEGVVGLVAAAFRNHPRDRFGTVVEFRGSFDDPRWSLWDVVGEVLRNTFVRALPKGLEGKIEVQEETAEGGAEGRGAVTILAEGEAEASTGGGVGGGAVKGSPADEVEAKDEAEGDHEKAAAEDEEAATSEQEPEPGAADEPESDGAVGGGPQPGVLGAE